MPKVTVAIPTFRRPRGLARLLDALEALQTDADVRVLVADNDAQGHEGIALCDRRAATYRWPLQAVVAPQRGIAQVRNVLVETALGDAGMDFLAMLDDDEWPEPRWLDAFLAEQAKTGADVLQGSVLFAVEDAWATSFDGISDIRHASGPVEMLQGAGNLLMARAALNALARPWFDPAFALTGGEDHDFFVRLKQVGLRFAWSDEAAAHSAVPAQRRSMGWALSRAYSIGNSDMRVFLKHERGWAARTRESARTVAALFASPVLFVLHAFSAQRRADALRRLFRALGKTSALFGLTHNAYSVSHGD